MLAGSLGAQQTVSFRVYTDPPGARFSVDGQIYTSVATFQWPVGSKHYVTFVQDTIPPVVNGSPVAPTLSPAQYSSDGSTAITFSGWVDSNGLVTPGSDPTQVVTADPSVTSLKANVTLNYRMLLNFFDTPPATLPPSCSGAPGTPSPDFRVGLVYIGAQCYWNNAILYFPAHQTLTLNAYPYPGFVFLGWSGNLGSSNAYLRTYTIDGPVTVAPRFSPAKRVRFITAPLGLQALVDRTATPTVSSEDTTTPCPLNQSLQIQGQLLYTPLCRGDFDFAPSSQHLVGAVTPQIDLQGKTWVYDSWSAQLGQSGTTENSIYSVDAQVVPPDKVTVKFIPGAHVSFVTSPSGLKLSVDGRTNWPAYNFVWGLGTTHTASAPAQQFDSAGRKYTFRSWSNGSVTDQTVTVDQVAVDSGYRVIANYDVLSRVIVQSSPAGLKLSVDGADCVTPCTLDRSNGSTIHLTAPTSIQLSDSARLDYAGWSDGGSADHIFTISSDSQVVTVNYNTSYRLSTAADPANGATFQFDPSSPDSYFPASSHITVSASANGGFKFRRWSGDLSGTYPSGVLIMSAPHAVVALMDRVPYIAPAGVQNAAGATPDATVAPGSLMAITGESLAPDSVTGRVNPLAQAIDNVTVTLGDRLLPLVSVSPEQVVAQLPSDVAPGSYTLQVHSQGQPDVSGDFTVARDAPGLFSTTANSQTYVLASHPDGSAVTPSNPAAQGETITILGTGFGPYATPVIDGFFPFDPAAAVSDPVDVLIGGQVFQPVSTTAASGYTGMVALKLKITSGMPAGTIAQLQVRVNGKLSNTVPLPLQ